MLRRTLRTVRYARSWKGSGHAISRNVEIVREGVAIPATLVLPRDGRGPFPAWIAMGGVSRMGRLHPQLVRFAEALAASGAAVLVPEVPEWKRLRVSPRVTAPTIRGCVDALGQLPEVRPGKYGLIGFSFGAPQVAISAARDDLAEHVAGVVLFGGYCSLQRTLTFQMTGSHEWEGVKYEGSPDPYGRWIVASNYLTSVPGYEDAGDVASALHTLADAASSHRVKAWEPYHDEMIEDLRAALPERHRRLFDHFARATDSRHGQGELGEDLAQRLAEACRRVDPLLEPVRDLESVHLPTRLIHGRGDRLIPFTEGLRLMAGLPSESNRGATVTALFDHSADRAPAAFGARVRERALLFRALHGLVNTV